METKNRRVKDIEDLANRSVCSLAQYTRDVREAIYFGRLCQTEEDPHNLLRLK